MIVIYLLTILIGFFWLLKMILAKKIIIKKTPFDLAIILFLVSQIVSTIFSIDRHVSIFGYYGRFNGGLVSIISFIFLFYGFVSNNINKQSILKTSLISSLIVIIYAIPGKLNHDLTCYFVSGGKITDNSCWSTEVNVFNPALRAFSTLGQPNWLAAFLAINFFIGLYFFIKEKKLLVQLIIGGYLFLNFSFILFSRSRSGLLSVIFALVILLIIFNKKILKYKKNFLIVFFLIFFSLIFFKTGISKVDQFLDFKNYIKNEKVNIHKSEKSNNQPILNITDSSDIRKIVWQGAIDLGKKYPFFGTGVETFAYSYYFVRPKAHNLVSEWDFVYNKAHNEYLNYFATTGFFGVISYLLMIFSVLFVFLKKIFFDKKEKNQQQLFFLLLSYLTILITNFFGFSTSTINLFFYLIPGFLVENINKENIEKKNNFNESQILLMIVNFIIFFYLIYSTLVYWQADKYYSTGLNYSKINDFQKSAFYLDKAIKLRAEPVYLDKYSSVLASLGFLLSYQNEKQLVSQLITLSKNLNEKTLKDSPYNIFYLKTKVRNQYYYFLTTLDKNYLFESIKDLEKGEKLAPTDPKIFQTKGLFYSLIAENEKDNQIKIKYYQKSVEELNKSISLKPDFYDAIELKKEVIKKLR